MRQLPPAGEGDDAGEAMGRGVRPGTGVVAGVSCGTGDASEPEHKTRISLVHGISCQSQGACRHT